MTEKYEEYVIEEVITRPDGTTYNSPAAMGKPEAIKRELYQDFANQVNNDRYEHTYEVFAYTPSWQKIQVGKFDHTLTAKNPAYLKAEAARIVGLIR